MGTVGEILAMKGTGVITIEAERTVCEAARMMTERGIGSLVVTQGGDPVGLITERDIIRRGVVQRRDLREVRVEELMSTEVPCCALNTTVDEARGAMKGRYIRHLPVMGDGYELVGLVSIGDLNAYMVDEQETTIGYLNEYLYGFV